MLGLERLLPVTKAFLKITVLATAAVCVATNGSAKALQVTANILNPSQVVTIPASGTPTLNFPTFTAANFPAAFAGLLPNQSLVLNTIKLTIAGAASGSFTVQNASTTQTVEVANNVYSLALVANGATATNPATLGNATSPVTPIATNGDASLVPVTCTPPAVAKSIVFGTITFYFCQTPGSQSYAITSAPITPFDWFIAPTGGNINSISSLFWTSGAQANIPAAITFTTDPTKLTDGEPTLVNPNPLTFTVSATPSNSFITYDYDLVNNGVPAPLPILGAGFAFSATRRIRRRIKQSV